MGRDCLGIRTTSRFLFCSASWRAVPITSSISGASIDRLRIELELAGLDLGKIEHLVDQAEQMRAGAMHAAQRLRRLLGAEARRVGEHHLGQPDDGVERRAQLVAHVGEELRLVLARELELAALVLQFVRTAAHSRSRSPPGRRRSRPESICLSLNGSTSRARQRHDADQARPSRSSGTARRVRTPALDDPFRGVAVHRPRCRRSGSFASPSARARSLSPDLALWPDSSRTAGRSGATPVVDSDAINSVARRRAAIVAHRAPASSAAVSVSASSTACRSKVERLISLSALDDRSLLLQRFREFDRALLDLRLQVPVGLLQPHRPCR